MKENTIYIIDDEGKQVEMKIYLTFDYDDKQYVVVYEDNNIDELPTKLGQILKNSIIGNKKTVVTY